VRFDLRERLRAKIGAIAVRHVPFDDPLQRRVEVPHRRPAEPLARLGRVQREESRLVRMRAGVEIPRQLAGPQLGDPVGDPAHRPCVIRRGAEVPALRECGVVPEALGQP
jgi:hypothetical protein